MGYGHGPVVGLCVECIEKAIQNGGLVLCDACKREMEEIRKAIENGELPRPSLLCDRCKESNKVGYVRVKHTTMVTEGGSATRIPAECDKCGIEYNIPEGPVGFPVGGVVILR